MVPYIGHEIVDILRSPAADRPIAGSTAGTALAWAEPEASAPCRRIALFVLSHILRAVTSKWMIYIILICL
jgi:hypothetical protein